jgi:hypothetical protein
VTGIAVIARGRLTAHGTLGELKSQVTDRMVVEIEEYGVDDTAGWSRERSCPRCSSRRGRVAAPGASLDTF